MLTDSSGALDVDEARKPLAEAQINATYDESNPGDYRAVFHLRPPLEDLDVSLRLVSRLPKA